MNRMTGQFSNSDAAATAPGINVAANFLQSRWRIGWVAAAMVIANTKKALP